MGEGHDVAWQVGKGREEEGTGPDVSIATPTNLNNLREDLWRQRYFPRVRNNPACRSESRGRDNHTMTNNTGLAVHRRPSEEQDRQAYEA